MSLITHPEPTGKALLEGEGGTAVLERESGGRLGVAVLDTKTGRNAAYRDTELFPLASTFKLLAAAAVLSLVDAGKTSLDTRIVFQAAVLPIIASSGST
jgi:beta-lactamase class A